MILYLNPTAESSLKYGSKVEGELITKTKKQTVICTSNGLHFYIPNKDILFKVIQYPTLVS